MTATTDALRELIVRRRLAPGEQVRQEDVSRRLGVSRSPLREALRALEAEGLVRHAPNQGYFVVRLDADELRQVYLMRSLLEPAVLGALPRLNREALAELKELNREIAAAPSARELLTANRRFHFAIFELSPLPVVVRELARLWNLSEPYQATYVAQPAARRTVVGEHEELIRALRAGDLGRVVTVAAAHRAAAEASVLALIG